MVGGKALCAGQKRSLVVRSKRLEFRGGLLTGEMIIIIYVFCFDKSQQKSRDYK